ncbi:uncharacterized protein EI90DRAFT_3017007 [Cantharellus anzutake]|uniref:uncharacterized protein n=1 Tax=Cantharellus anzutake TaxID=1750568 RepID=UPI0019062AED|nr:uncharacterized protein EI90DRAFT_3017007 [Cantharellus anzutake]KAF8330083.1 hypothetical protein EI90DRAFT_3017007 [Cantharellus anzutake]
MCLNLSRREVISVNMRQNVSRAANPNPGFSGQEAAPSLLVLSLVIPGVWPGDRHTVSAQVPVAKGGLSWRRHQSLTKFYPELVTKPKSDLWALVLSCAASQPWDIIAQPLQNTQAAKCLHLMSTAYSTLPFVTQITPTTRDQMSVSSVLLLRGRLFFLRKSNTWSQSPLDDPLQVTWPLELGINSPYLLRVRTIILSCANLDEHPGGQYTLVSTTFRVGPSNAHDPLVLQRQAPRSATCYATRFKKFIVYTKYEERIPKPNLRSSLPRELSPWDNASRSPPPSRTPPLQLEKPKAPSLNPIKSSAAFKATLVAVGGVVDVLYLRIADQTDDIEFLGPAISHRTYLEVAMHGAIAHLGLPSRKIEQTNKLPVGENWQSLMEVLGRGPRETIFRQPGLQVVAAPWNYGFCVKMDMLRRGATGAITPTPRHVSDAAVYLDSVIKHQPPDRLPFTERELYRILTDYSVQVSELSVGHVLNTYRTLYKREPLAPRR